MNNLEMIAILFVRSSMYKGLFIKRKEGIIIRKNIYFVQNFF
jgi:hypothetical protein